MNHTEPIAFNSPSEGARQGARKEARNAGFSLLEVMMGLTVLTVALLGLGALLVANERTREASAQNVQATHRLRSIAENIRSVQFADVSFWYSNYAFVDLVSGAPGTTKAFLNEMDSSPDALLLGLPRDLDGDGLVSNTNVTSYDLLPMKVTITLGAETYSLFFLLSDEA